MWWRWPRAGAGPAAVGAGAPATRGAAAELVDELVEDVGEAGSELAFVAAVVGWGFVFVIPRSM